MQTTFHFQEVPQRLGFETQKHCSELAIRRVGHALLALFFSMVRLLAHQRMTKRARPASDERGLLPQVRDPTFSDALALVGRQLWAQEQTLCGSPSATDTVKVPESFL
jgi:hypothetical protein